MYMDITIIKLVCLFIRFFLYAEKPKIQPIVWEGSSPSTTQQPRPRPINTRGAAQRGQLQTRGTRGGTFQRGRVQMPRGRGASRGARGGAYRSPNMYWWSWGHISYSFFVLGEFSYDKCSLINLTIVKECGKSQTEFSVVFVDILNIVRVMEFEIIESCHTLLMTAVKSTESNVYISRTQHWKSSYMYMNVKRCQCSVQMLVLVFTLMYQYIEWCY